MNTLRLRVFPDPILRENTEPVADFGDELKDIVAEMVRLMRVHDGVGLAAPQAGLSLRLAVVLFEDTLHVLANPELLSSEGEQDGEEGCLSFPGIYAPVSRSAEVTVKFLDLKGKPQELRLKKFVARVAQHEIDHVNGVLFVDRMSRIKRIALSGQLKRLKKETREALETA